MILKDRKVLAKLMVLDGVTQRELAAAAGWTTHSYLGRLLRGEARKIRPEPARRIANRLGVSVSDLFDQA
jgi:transcriptional regulator with XRE-family HTH domain